MLRKLGLLGVLLIIGYGPRAAAQEEDLALYLPFDEGTGTVAEDQGVFDLEVTLTGAYEWTPGKLGQAVAFTGGQATVVDSDSLNVTLITVMAWINPTAITANIAPNHYTDIDSIYAKAGQADDSVRLGLTGGDGAHFYVDNGANRNLSVPDAGVETNEWQHIAATFDGTVTRILLNGQQVGEMDVQGTLISNTNQVTVAGGTFRGIVDDLKVYDRGLTPDEVARAMQGQATVASTPQPPTGATDTPGDTTLSWSASDFAVSHDVYFGTVFNDVNEASRADPRGVLAIQGQTATTFDPGTLSFGSTYYWRVDEVNAPPDSSIFKGDVWSFTVEPFVYPITNVIATASHADAGVGPESTADGSGLNANDEHSVDAPDMWLASPGPDEPLWIQYEFDRVYKLYDMIVWNYNVQFEPVLGFGVRDVTIEHSVDGLDWTVLGDVEFARATATAGYTANTTVDLSAVVARFVRINVNSGYGVLGQFGLSEVRFTFKPVQARQPQPASGQDSVGLDPALDWRGGREAAAHELYFSTDPNAVANGAALLETVEESRYQLDALDYGTTYYWKVDEVNEAATPATWEGETWDFSTTEFFVVEDFESYDDEENRIFDTWLDGFVNETGSTVGYFDAPFAETSIVHGGGQSMPFEYANDGAPFYSEAEYDLGSTNWMTNGADTLKLFVAGQAPVFLETTDGSILMNAIGIDIWSTADEFRYAYKTLTGDGSMTVRVDAIDGSPNGWVKGGVMIRQSTEAGSVNAFTAITGGSGDGATFQWRPTADADSSSSRTLTGVAPPYYARIIREGNTFTGYLSVDGVEWAQQGDTSADVAMTDPVLIGLALTSHNANQATSAEFSNITSTGNVSAGWEMADIGAAQPTEGNTPESLYVAIEDTSGNLAVVTNPDPSITARSGWNEWLIPFDNLTGVNLSRVAILYIGVGDRDNPTVGGTGLILLDDILVGHPAEAEQGH